MQCHETFATPCDTMTSYLTTDSMETRLFTQRPTPVDPHPYRTIT